ncbi:MAG: class I SAM-dependent methyltransferase [Mycobacteriales bacterium]
MPRLIEAGLLSYWLTQQRVRAAAPHLRGRVLDYACGVGILSQACRPELYLGYDIDPRKIEIAREDRPAYTFSATPPHGESFDTVAALAFIEHVSDPAATLAELAGYLRPGGTLVLTTPHPDLEWVHTGGARLHLFSPEAHDDHEELIDRNRMARLLAGTGLVLTDYRRFLLGANQLFLIRRD